MVSTRSNRIPTTAMTALTLHADRETTHRRNHPVPQLTCIGTLCYQYEPETIQCQAVGQDGGGGLEWKCQAELPNGIKFGQVEVGCEGWDGPDDEYILRGSCALTYSLVPSTKAFERGQIPYRTSSRPQVTISTSSLNLLVLVLFVYCIYTLVPSLVTRIHRFLTRRPRPRSHWSGGPGNNNDGDGGPPPPPYSRSPPPSKIASGSSSSNWRPGFWSGLAAGAVADRFLRPSTTTASEYDRQTRERAGFRTDDDRQVRRTGWGTAASLRNCHDDDDLDRSIGGSGFTRSTGFGGTRNR
ncbi:uncharacterized protein JCM15063_002934 [Sporobolomyces koalae]|uniref:uncharacterized protein n=1 Tax=Sporobolomyces koalae TaxID=500713 RepID=UPI003174A0EF